MTLPPKDFGVPTMDLEPKGKSEDCAQFMVAQTNLELVALR